MLLWSGLGVILLLAFVAAIGAVQRTYYSASGFVSAYVAAVAAHDVQAALAMPGAAPTATALESAGLPKTASRELLRSDVLPTITDATIVSDAALSSGAHRVTVRVRADGQSVTAVFTVRPSGSVLGVLPTWTFATSPLSLARVTVAHAGTFTVGRHTLNPRAANPGQPADAFNVAADYLLFAPARYELGHRSTALEAVPAIVVPKPGELVESTVDAQPTPAFTRAVEEQLNSFLDGCTKQDVLQPTGCPFGVDIDDRVQGTPTWTMVDYPPVRLEAGPTSWVMGDTPGVVHLSVTVQSLFDGTVQQRESDELFTVSLNHVAIHQDGSLDIVVGQ